MSVDLAELLKRAIDEHAADLEAQAAPFVGRITFHVDLDTNVAMQRITPRIRPCHDGCAMDTRAA